MAHLGMSHPKEQQSLQVGFTFDVSDVWCTFKLRGVKERESQAVLFIR